MAKMEKPEMFEIGLTRSEALVIAEFLRLPNSAADELWPEQRHGLDCEGCDALRSIVVEKLRAHVQQ